jgi:hypothetical protein
MATDVALEVAHVLFMDVVGYSKLLINDQTEVLAQLNQVVRATAHFQKAEAEGVLDLRVKIVKAKQSTARRSALRKNRHVSRAEGWRIEMKSESQVVRHHS